jgi:hypothetical protein
VSTEHAVVIKANQDAQNLHNQDIWAFDEPHQTGDPSFEWILSGQERRLLKGLPGFACCRGNARRVRHKQPQVVQSRDLGLCMA